MVNLPSETVDRVLERVEQAFLVGECIRCGWPPRDHRPDSDGYPVRFGSGGPCPGYLGRSTRFCLDCDALLTDPAPGQSSACQACARELRAAGR